MPQLHFPFFPEGLTHINSDLAFGREGGKVWYHHGMSRMCSHDEDDYDGFKSVISEYCASGVITQAEAARAFGVTTPTSIKRAVRLYLKSGRRGFFAQRRTRGAVVLTAPVLLRAQELLDQGLVLPDVADQLGLKRNTVSKALKDGRLRIPAKTLPKSLLRRPLLAPKVIAAQKIARQQWAWEPLILTDE